MTPKSIALFWLRVDKDAGNGCWRWTGKLHKGYGTHAHTSAHRFSWELHYGPVPEGRWVLHNCPGVHNRACVNPRHLKLGDVKANALDAVETGGIARGERHGSKTHPEAVVRGERHPAALLTDEQVMDIRVRWSEGRASRGELAQEYRLKVGTVGHILDGTSWRHLPVLPKPAVPQVFRPERPQPTHCPNGHEYTPENTGKQQGRWRVCRACKAIWARKNRARKANE